MTRLEHLAIQRAVRSTRGFNANLPHQRDRSLLSGAEYGRIDDLLTDTRDGRCEWAVDVRAGIQRMQDIFDRVAFRGPA